MKKEVMLQIASEAMEIGRSSKHFVTIDLSMNNRAFPVTVYIHMLDAMGVSNGIEDTVSFNMDGSYELHKEWLEKWTKIIAKEREEDAANES